MLIQHNYLRTYRKRAPLSVKDIMKIIGLERPSTVTRWENGSRVPGIQTLLMFHLLYGISIEDLFRRQVETLLPDMQERLLQRINELRSFPQSPKMVRRSAFLENALTRLSKNTL